MIYDLHTHSNKSDGILSPCALVSRAKCNNVDILALTDHDTTSGVAAAQAAAHACGLRLITGIEFSTLWQGRGVHIVGLNMAIDNPDFVSVVNGQSLIRKQRAQIIAAKLDAHLGLENSLEAVERIADGAVIGRPHFARLLLEKGLVSKVSQAFSKYLGTGKLGDVKHAWPQLAAIVASIQHAGGVAVLAHPAKYALTRSKLCALVSDFAEAGGQAIEVISGRQESAKTADLAKIANNFGLYASCGSDFHVPGQSWQELGQFSCLPNTVKPVWTLW